MFNLNDEYTIFNESIFAFNIYHKMIELTIISIQILSIKVNVFVA